MNPPSKLKRMRILTVVATAAVVQYALLSLFLFALVQPAVYQAAIIPPPAPMPPPVPLPARDAFSCRQCNTMQLTGIESAYACFSCNSSYAEAVKAADVEPIPPHPSADYFRHRVIEDYYANHTWLMQPENCTMWDAAHCEHPFRPQSSLLGWVLSVSHMSIHPVCIWCVIGMMVTTVLTVAYVVLAITNERARVREVIARDIVRAASSSLTRHTAIEDDAPPAHDSIFDTPSSLSFASMRQRNVPCLTSSSS